MEKISSSEFWQKQIEILLVFGFLFVLTGLYAFWKGDVYRSLMLLTLAFAIPIGLYRGYLNGIVGFILGVLLLTGVFLSPHPIGVLILISGLAYTLVKEVRFKNKKNL